MSKFLWPYHSLKSRERERERERERDKKESEREIEKHSKCQPGILLHFPTG